MFDVNPAENLKLRGMIYIRLNSQMIVHSRRVMLLFDFLGKIGGVNRLLWTLGGLLLGYLYKDRMVIETLENLYELKDKGQEIKDIKASDILKKQVFCCFKTKRAKQVNKVIEAGKKKLSLWFDMRKQILRVDYKG